MTFIDKAIQALQAFKKGKTIQVLYNNPYSVNIWYDVEPEKIFEVLSSARDLRVKPEPVYKPWSFVNHPTKEIWIKVKESSNTLYKIKEWEVNNVLFGDSYWAFYEHLFNSYVQADGSPCGFLCEERELES